MGNELKLEFHIKIHLVDFFFLRFFESLKLNCRLNGVTKSNDEMLNANKLEFSQQA